VKRRCAKETEKYTWRAFCEHGFAKSEWLDSGSTNGCLVSIRARFAQSPINIRRAGTAVCNIDFREIIVPISCLTLTLACEIAERRGDSPSAEQHFGMALALEAQFSR
jgi:hypothetical protein